MINLETRRWSRGLIFLIVAALLAPLFMRPAVAVVQQPRPMQKPGMTTKKKLVLLAGAALLYYLYRKHQATRTRTTVNGGTASARQPQLYRSKNGGIYYRDPQGRPVWLTVPNKRVEVPLEEVRRYAPNYSRYRGPAPAVPRGYKTEPFSDFRGDLLPGPQEF